MEVRSFFDLYYDYNSPGYCFFFNTQCVLQQIHLKVFLYPTQEIRLLGVEFQFGESYFCTKSLVDVSRWNK